MVGKLRVEIYDEIQAGLSGFSDKAFLFLAPVSEKNWM